MTKKLEIYKCNICGNIVEVLHCGQGELVCCAKPMKQLEENTVDAAQEKHVPVIEKGEGTTKVKVGSVPHPMQEDHYIEFVEIICGDKISRHFLKPGQDPEAIFKSCNCDCKLVAREYCNIHGLWRNN